MTSGLRTGKVYGQVYGPCLQSLRTSGLRTMLAKSTDFRSTDHACKVYGLPVYGLPVYGPGPEVYGPVGLPARSTDQLKYLRATNCDK